MKTTDMKTKKTIGGWGKQCEWACSYDNDNYYLLIWNDPNAMEIRTTAQVREALEASLAEDDCVWEMRDDSASFCNSRNIDDLMSWLNQDQEGAERIPAENFISDDCGYVWIRRILSKVED